MKIFLLFTLVLLNQVNATTLEVAMSNVSPFSYNDNGQLKGFNYDILKQIETISGLNFHYSLVPHARLLFALPEENPDLLILLKTACDHHNTLYEAQASLYQSEPIIVLKKGIDPSKKDIRVARLIGTCSALMEENVKKELRYDVANIDQAFSMLNDDRIDGICGIESVIKFSQQRLSNKDPLVFYKREKNLDNFKAVLCLKKSLPDSVKKKLNSAVKKIKIPDISIR